MLDQKNPKAVNFQGVIRIWKYYIYILQNVCQNSTQKKPSDLHVQN